MSEHNPDGRVPLSPSADTSANSPRAFAVHGGPGESATSLLPPVGRSRSAGERDSHAPAASLLPTDIPPPPVPVPGSVSRVAGLPVVPGYEILGVLGRGGMGVVYKARQIGAGRIVALKMIRGGGDAPPEERRRFAAEAQAAARLQHPNIIQVYEVGEHDGQPFFSQEFVRGGSLADRLDGTPVAARDAARLAAAMADGVAAAHASGVVHRDLKPANVLMAEDGSPKIADFGLAKRLDAIGGHTQSGALLGTPSYMAPEQAFGNVREVGPGADVYALGAILYELLTGRPPFKGETTFDTLRQVRDVEPVQPGRLNPRLPRDLETVCVKCLHKEVYRRYHSAAELGDDLRRFLNREPVRARPVGLLARGLLWSRRNTALAAASVLTVGALVAAAVTGVLSAVAQAQASEVIRQQQASTQAALEESEKNRKLLQAAVDQLRLTDGRRRAALVLSADLALSQGMALCDQGDVGKGLLLLTKALEVLPPEAGELDRLIRLNLSDIARRRRLPRAFFPHNAVITDAAISADGRLIVTAGKDGRARFWEAATGRPTGIVLTHFKSVTCVALSPDGRTAATACEDHNARMWDTATGRPLCGLLVHDSAVWSVSFSPDGKTLATGAAGGQARLWDAANGEAVGPVFAHGNEVNCIAFSPDGKSILTASQDRQARLWDRASGRVLAVFPHAAEVNVVAFSPDGTLVATGCRDRNAWLWKLSDHPPLGQPLPHNSNVEAVAFSPQGDKLVTGCSDGTFRFWDVAARRPLDTFSHQGAVSAVNFSRDGRTVLTGSHDGTALLWGADLAHPDPPAIVHPAVVASVAFSPDGKSVLTACKDGRVRVWERSTRRQLGAPLDHGRDLQTMAISPDGRTVLTGGPSSAVQLHDFASGRLIVRVSAPGGVNCATFSPDGKLILAGCPDASARMWFADTGQPFGNPLPHKDAVECVALSPDGRFALTGSKDQAYLWDVRTSQPLFPPFGHSQAVRSVAFNPDGRTCATGDAEGLVRLWTADTGKPVGPTLKERGGEVRSIAFSPDGRLIVTGTAGGMTQLWDTATGRAIGLPRRHRTAVNSVAFDPRGEVVLAGCADGTAQLTDVPTQLPGDVELITGWSQALTGMRLDPDGVFRGLGNQAWQRARELLSRPPAR